MRVKMFLEVELTDIVTSNVEVQVKTLASARGPSAMTWHKPGF